MTESESGARRTSRRSKEAFVPSEDRPEVKIDLDTPLSELRVRELSSILGYMVQKSPNFEVGKGPLKDFFDKPFPEVAKDWIKEIKSEKIEKPEKEKLEKIEKPEKEKLEKLEKPERKELKPEKLEIDIVVEPADKFPPDPRLQQVIEAVAGLSQQVGRLADQVTELEKRTRG